MLQRHYPEITREGDEEDVVFKPTVEYFYYPGSMGRCERGSGLALEPEEPASADILRITLDGKPFEVSPFELVMIEQELSESLQ